MNIENSKNIVCSFASVVPEEVMPEKIFTQLPIDILSLVAAQEPDTFNEIAGRVRKGQVISESQKNVIQLVLTGKKEAILETSKEIENLDLLIKNEKQTQKEFFKKLKELHDKEEALKKDNNNLQQEFDSILKVIHKANPAESLSFQKGSLEQKSIKLFVELEELEQLIEKVAKNMLEQRDKEAALVFQNEANNEADADLARELADADLARELDGRF